MQERGGTNLQGDIGLKVPATKNMVGIIILIILVVGVVLNMHITDKHDNLRTAAADDAATNVKEIAALRVDLLMQESWVREKLVTKNKEIKKLASEVEVLEIPKYCCFTNVHSLPTIAKLAFQRLEPFKMITLMVGRTISEC